MPGAAATVCLAWIPSAPGYLWGVSLDLDPSKAGSTHALELPTCTPALAHLPWWSFCSSQQWASCKAKAALERWCSPSRPRLNGSPTSSRASNGGHRYSGHCGGAWGRRAGQLTCHRYHYVRKPSDHQGLPRPASIWLDVSWSLNSCPRYPLAHMRNPNPTRDCVLVSTPLHPTKPASHSLRSAALDPSAQPGDLRAAPQ